MATIPTNPSNGDTFTDGAGVTWTYNLSSNKWLIPLGTAGGGGGGGGPRFQQTITSSGTFTPLLDGDAYLILVGGGGSGAVGRDPLTSGASSWNLAGGGAGGMCIHKATLATSQSYSLTCGAGHTNSLSLGSNSPGAQNGGTGGTSTLSGNDISLTANGGNGGQAASAPRTDTNVAGGTGGSASGANIYNVTGGRGANVVRSQTGATPINGAGGSCGGTESVWYNTTETAITPLPDFLLNNSYELKPWPSGLATINKFDVTTDGTQQVWRGNRTYFTFGSTLNEVNPHPGGGSGSGFGYANNGTSSLSVTGGSGALTILYFG